MAARACSSEEKANGKLAALNFEGTARWPVRTTSDISPSATFSTVAGMRNRHGRLSTAASVFENARLFSGVGAVTLTAPATPGFVSSHSTAPTQSSRWIHGQY